MRAVVDPFTLILLTPKELVLTIVVFLYFHNQPFLKVKDMTCFKSMT